MGFRILSAAALGIALAAVSSANAAEPGPFVTRLMGRAPGEGKTFACFTRVYDDRHLVAHPQQNVASLTLLAVAYSSLQYGYQLRIGLRFRDRAEPLSTVAECGVSRARNSLRHGAICAGIGGTTRLAIENRRSILLRLPVGANLWRPGPPGQSTVDDAFGADDKPFRLYRAALSHCDDQAIGVEEKALLDRGH